MHRSIEHHAIIKVHSRLYMAKRSGIQTTCVRMCEGYRERIWIFCLFSLKALAIPF